MKNYNQQLQRIITVNTDNKTCLNEYEILCFSVKKPTGCRFTHTLSNLF